MKLSEVVRGLSTAAVPEVEVTGLTADSRQVRPGYLFFAVPGTRADGLTFASDAAARGAVAVVASKPAVLNVPVVVVSDAHEALWRSAAVFYGHPANRLMFLGVTGTNGKTTTTYLVESIARAGGTTLGVVGTVSFRVGGWRAPATHTTPDPAQLQGLLREFVNRGAAGVAMEVSSHALDQRRVAGLTFRAAAFTNLTRDHLDYHGTIERYFAAKTRLFLEYLAADGVAVVNADDSYGMRLAEMLRTANRTVWPFSLRGASGSAVSVSRLRHDLAGIRMSIDTPRRTFEVESPLVGAHNVENILAATGLALAAGFDTDAVCRGVAALPSVPGRLERLPGVGPAVFVDYAHTDDALTRSLAALRPLCKGRLLAVFGCGGDRDRGKRPLMGEAAARGADFVFVTTDNPRGEAPEAIISEIVPGLERAGMRPGGKPDQRGYSVVPDRDRAITLAIQIAEPEDAVLIAGKGHEDYQIVGDSRLHFDDREVAVKALANRGTGN